MDTLQMVRRIMDIGLKIYIISIPILEEPVIWSSFPKRFTVEEWCVLLLLLLLRLFLSTCLTSR